MQSRRCFHCLVHSALPAVPRDSTGLKDSVTLTLSPSMSLASTKAIWGAAESLSNKITLSICTLHGSDCRVLRLPIPRHWTYFSSFSSTLLILAYMTNSNWKPHTPEVGAQSTVRLKKRPPAHQTKLYSLKARIERMERETNERKDKSPFSLCDLGRQKNKLCFCLMAPSVKIDIGSHSGLFVFEHTDIGSISSHKRAREVHGPTSQPFI